MTILIFALFLLLNVSFLNAQEQTEIKQLYQLPETSSVSSKVSEQNSFVNNFLIGSDNGLYRITSNNSSLCIWNEGRVDQLLLLENENSDGTKIQSWAMRTSKGIFVTQDLENFEERDKGLPFLTIKRYENGQKSLEKQIQELKDISANPLNNNELVTATKDNVYYSSDCGRSWKNIGSMSRSSPGIKAVAVVTLDGETVVFMSHNIFGLSYIFPNRDKPVWTDVTEGFEKMTSLTSPDEIADIYPFIKTDSQGNKKVEIYISQTYMPRIYRFNWQEKKGELLYSGKAYADVIDGLYEIDDVVIYTKLEGFGCLNTNWAGSYGDLNRLNDWNKAFASVPGTVNTAWVPQSRSGFSKGVLLNELWLLYPGSINTPYAEKANGRKCIYASAYQCSSKEGVDKFKKIIKDRNMNGIVIDMKDDYGLLRYDSKNPLVLKKGQVTQYAIDLNEFIKDFKDENIYLVARIVTFKDRTLSRYAGGKYAVWDSRNNKAWMGVRSYANEENPEAEYYDENWVDPYSEEVWEYNVEIAKELIERGFDEIQFDYIRFPTDGLNLRSASYRWQDKGMDKESALISFLSYARENIKAPISIDIYGANGWYRSGTRTGQDAEMLAEYVDVIGPMFYPSHFEQTFLNYPPAADRTYRIYYYGSFRNTVLARNRAIIRPWVQSFYLNVSYDRLYYDSDYIKKQFFGTRDAINRGYMCWNNAGNYGVTPPDITDSEVFIGTTPESSDEFKKPAIGTALKPLHTDDFDISILDSILFPTYEDEEKAQQRSYLPFLQVAPGR